MPRLGPPFVGEKEARPLGFAKKLLAMPSDPGENSRAQFPEISATAKTCGDLKNGFPYAFFAPGVQTEAALAVPQNIGRQRVDPR